MTLIVIKVGAASLIVDDQRLTYMTGMTVQFSPVALLSLQGSLMASGQEVQLQQLQLLQQQLVMHTEMMSSKPQQTPPVIDNNLLAQIKLLTDQLLSKTDAPAPVSAPPQPSTMAQSLPEGAVGDGGGETKREAEPGFNRVRFFGF